MSNPEWLKADLRDAVQALDELQSASDVWLGIHVSMLNQKSYQKLQKARSRAKVVIDKFREEHEKG